MNALIIRANGNLEVRNIEGRLEEFQEMVGGLIEAIEPYPPLGSVTLYANEESKMSNDVRWNYVATKLCFPNDEDVVAGDVVVIGWNARTDVYSDVPDNVIQAAKSFARRLQPWAEVF